MILNISIKFNKDMTNEIPPTLGGFHVKDQKNNHYEFDFNTSEFSVNSHDPKIVDYVLKDEDIDTFPEVKRLQNKWLDLKDWCEIYMDYEGGTADSVQAVAVQTIVIEQCENHDQPEHETEINEIAIKTYLGKIARYEFYGKFLDKATKALRNN